MSIILFKNTFQESAKSADIAQIPDFSQFLTGMPLEEFLTRVQDNKQVLIVGVITQPPFPNLEKWLQGQTPVSTQPSEHPPDRLSQDDIPGISFLPTSYAKWIHRDNVILVPLDTSQTVEELVSVASYLGGLLMPGGKTNLFRRGFKKPNDEIVYAPEIPEDRKNFLKQLGIDFDQVWTAPGEEPVYNSNSSFDEPTQYAKKVFAILDSFKKRMDDDKELRLPVHGTCLGLQQLILSEVMGPPLMRQVNNFKYKAGMNPINPDESDSIASWFNDEQVKQLKEGKTFYYNHKYAFPVAAFTNDSNLAKLFEVMATTIPKLAYRESKNVPLSEDSPAYNPEFDFPIVAAARSRTYPFFGVQFHPEKNEFEPHLHIPFDSVSDKPILDVFVDHFYAQANKFATATDIQKIRQYLAKYRMFKATGYPSFEEMFLMSRLAPRSIMV